MVSTDVVTKKAGLPAGEYQIVAWDLDTTGRRLIDEFCHIAGFTPDQKFTQYVMPYKDLDMISKRRHLMRTVTVGKYRMLKDLKTGTVSGFQNLMESFNPTFLRNSILVKVILLLKNGCCLILSIQSQNCLKWYLDLILPPCIASTEGVNNYRCTACSRLTGSGSAGLRMSSGKQHRRQH